MQSGQSTTEENSIVSFPIIELQKDITSGTAEEIKINVSVSSENKNGIAYILTPDGNKKEKNGESYVNFQYTVNENGKYSFSACDASGNISEESIEISNIKNDLSEKPYIPAGFEYIEGEVETGYVIGDSYGNQYVWVPVESGNLTRDRQFDEKYAESDACVLEFKNSVAKYCGFYIARYEAFVTLKNNVNVVYSCSGQIPTTNLSYQDAFKFARENYINLEYTDCSTALVNSFAYDTTLDWINKSTQDYSSSDQYGNYSGIIKTSGETIEDEKNKICDLAGNVREWTTESYNTGSGETKKRVIRGGSAVTDRTAGSYTAVDEENCDNYCGFRMILYK